MASGVHIDVAGCNGMVDYYVDRLDAAAGSMKVFSGALPAECATADPTAFDG